MLQAAAAVDPGFKIMLMPDMSALQDKSDATIAESIATMASSPSAFHLADGRLVVSPFQAELRSVSWWKSFIQIMRDRYGIRVALVPLFVDDSTDHKEFDKISYGLSNWGTRNPAWNNPAVISPSSAIARATSARSRGKIWMQPVSVQDERPRSGLFDEAENTTNLRNTWQIAITGDADWVQLTTWNDYTEGTAFAPSVHHGWSYLDISSYYLTWFKTGHRPTIVRDTVYLTHRTQPWAATPTFPESMLMKWRGGSPPRDTVEALTFLTAPATVEVTVGGHMTSCRVAAGEDVCTVPLGLGSVSVRVVRDGNTVAAASSPFPVTATPYVQDLEYAAVSSRRS
jgi:hypothetical protein